MTNANESAFSRPASDRSHHSTAIDETNGLTKREYFAAMAMQGLCASITTAFPDELAFDAVKLADAIINELNKGEKQ